ncbi:MAG: CHASE3 domain-containing protein [Calothrix sp. C42_A2020_038]|nr:CHASE3 domain-containing protein [Calothrix sp. C42_A2020_038]
MKQVSNKVITGSLGLALSLLSVVIVASFLNIRQASQDKKWMIHTYEVLNTLKDMNAGLLSAESRRQDYILIKKTSYIENYLQDQAKVYQSLQKLYYLTKDNPRQQRKLDDMKHLIEKRFFLFDKSIKLFQQNSQDLISQVAITEENHILREPIDTLSQAIEDEETSLLNLRMHKSSTNVRRMIFWVGLGNAFGLIIIVSVYSLLQKQISINKDLSQQAATLEKQVLRTRLVNFLESTTDAFVAVDTNWNYTYVNRRAGEILNHAPEELVGKNIWLVFPEIVGQNFYYACQKAALEQQMMQIEEYYSPLNRWYENRIYPSKDGISIFFQDITERKQTEAIIYQLNQELEARVEQRTVALQKSEAELQKLNQELLRSNQELEQFAYVVSHDLQEPLRAVIAFTQLLKARYLESADESVQKYLDTIIDAGKRMHQLIYDLLTYSRVSTRRQNFTLINPNQALNQTLTNLRVAITESKANITCDALPQIVADKTQLVQLFQNLIANAIKFCKKQPQIHVGVRLENQKYVFSVKDNGIGIKPQYTKSIFEIFRRLHTREEFPGTGIGLAICKKIIELHGGNIWVESIPDIGTTFYFTWKVPDDNNLGSKFLAPSPKS